MSSECRVLCSECSFQLRMQSFVFRMQLSSSERRVLCSECRVVCVQNAAFQLRMQSVVFRMQSRELRTRSYKLRIQSLGFRIQSSKCKTRLFARVWCRSLSLSLSLTLSLLRPAAGRKLEYLYMPILELFYTERGAGTGGSDTRVRLGASSSHCQSVAGWKGPSEGWMPKAAYAGSGSALDSGARPTLGRASRRLTPGPD